MLHELAPVVTVAGATATPMLTETVTSRWSRVRGPVTCCRRLAATVRARRRAAGEEDGELVAAEAGDEIAVPERRAQALGHGVQDFVARAVPNVSLISLKRSRSSRSRAMSWPFLRCSARSVFSCSRSSARLGRPGEVVV